MKKDHEPGEQKNLSFIEHARRAPIVEAAGATVAEVGYAQTSLARIADTAGVSKGVLTYDFANKHEILRMKANQFYDNAGEYMEERSMAQDTAAGQLRAWLGAELEYFGTHRTEFLARSDVVANHRGGDGSHAFVDEFEEEITGLSDILSQGQQDDQF